MSSPRRSLCSQLGAFRQQDSSMPPKHESQEPPHELELKLAVTKAEIERVEVAIGDGVIDCTAPGKAKLRTIYFDTPEQALRAHGISLRARHRDKRWRQALKVGAPVRGGLSNPLELEADLDGPFPDLDAVADDKVRKRVKKIIGKSALQPLFEIAMDRTRAILALGDGGEVEIALDRGTVKADKARRGFAEIELELRRGGPDTLLDAARVLAELVPLRPAQTSKAERGYRLLPGSPAPQWTAFQRKPRGISLDQSSAQAFVAASAAAIEPLLHNWQVLLRTDDPEGPHQLRVSLRRLRATIKAFNSVIGADALAAFEAELRDLGQIVSALRDRDVLLADIVAPVPKPELLEPAFDELAEAVRKAAEHERKRTRDALARPDWSLFQIRLALFSRGAGWDMSTAVQCLETRSLRDTADAVLDRRWRQVLKLGRRIEELTVPERHELRKKLKMLRYTLDVFAPLLPRDSCKGFTKHLKSLQDVFGYLNDATLAYELCSIRPPSSQDESAFEHAIGFVVGYHQCRSESMWEHARRRWDVLIAAERPWETARTGPKRG